LLFLLNQNLSYRNMGPITALEMSDTYSDVANVSRCSL